MSERLSSIDLPFKLPPSVRPPRLNRLLQRLKMDNLTGLRLIAEGTSLADRGVDIVAIHGLGGYDNWKHPTDGPSDDSEAIFWLRDFLPIDLPSARIFTYHYIVSTICADEGIEVIADKLLTKLQNLQKDNVKRPRPLVFICHSLGSLLLQCALVRAFDNKGDKSLNEIIRSTQGIVFLGAPHSTSFQELSTGVLRIAAASKTTQVTMGAIKRMGQILLRFASLPLHSLPWRVVHCFEELPLPSTGLRAVDASRGESWALPPVSLYSHHLDLCRFATQQDLSYIKVLQSLRNITSGSRSPVVDETTQATTLSSIEDEVLRILQIEDASTSVRDASRGTCDWILKHDIYKSWLDMPSQPLWIIGNPGSGKSTMMKHIVEYHRLQKEPSRVLMQFFFGFGSNQSVKSLLSSLLHQLLKAAPTTQTFEIFSRLLERRELEGPNKTWGNDILAESLLKLADKSTATGDSLFIIIDALDECDDPGMVVDLLQRLNSLNSRRRIHICISSRPYNFLTQLRPVTEIRMEDNNSFDIERYLHSRLSILGDHLPPTLDVKTITQTLTGRAQGGFLWVSLVMSRLSCDSYFKTLDTEKDFTPSLPTSLEEAYETILRRLWSLHDGGHRKAAQDALILVLCAQRPLSILELWSALAATHDDLDFFTARVEFGTHRQSSYEEIPQSKERAPLDMTVQLMVLCGGLLEVTPWPSKSPNDTSCATKSTVRLVHSSVRDFFLGNLSHALESGDKRSQDPKSLQLPEQRGARYRHAQYHFQVGWLCLLYVNHVDADFHITKDKTSNSSTPFLAYSLSFGMLHLSLAEQMGVTPMTEDTHQFPPFQKRCLEQWTLLHHQMFEDQRLFEPRKTKAVHIMSYYGFPWYTSGLWAADLADINEQDHYGRTALHLAAAMGHHAICESLLLHGADISHRDHVYGQTPLIVAAAHGQRRVVQLLLSKGSNHDDRMSGVTPLWLAVRSGSRDTVELLLDAGADPKATSIHTGETCLSRAAALGHVRVIHLLLEHGAEVVTWDNIGWTPLHHAVSRGRKKTLEVLLSFLTPDQLYKLRDSFSDGNTDSSWITKVLRAIILWVCYKRGGESQTRAAGDESTQLPRTTVRSRGPKKLGRRGQKHRRDDESEGDDCEEDDKGIPEKRARRSNPSGRRFACPYHKRNEARFSTGACNGTGFENIDRLKRHLKKRHDRATGWRRCSNCRQLFLREEYVGHAPCERQDRPIDYEDGYDQDQAEDLLPKNICLRSGTEESCWKRIFKVLFPDWPQDREVPSPYHETQVQVISTNYVQAIQEHRNIVMDPRTISRITAFQNEEETRQFMDRLIGNLESNFGLVPSTAGNLLPEAMPTVPSQQPNVSNQYLEPQFMPPPEIPLYRLNGSFYNEGHPSFSNPTVSTSHESSSQFLPEDTQADRYTEYTAASDQFSTVFECGWAIPSMGSSMNSSQLQQQLVPPSAPQQPADNTDYNLESRLSGTNQGPDLTHSLLDSRRGSGRHSSWQDLEQGNPPPEWL